MNYRHQIIIGFVLGMFALVMLSFKVSMDSMTTYQRQLEQTRFRLIREATENYKEPINIVITADETLIINYDPDSILWK